MYACQGCTSDPEGRGSLRRALEACGWGFQLGVRFRYGPCEEPRRAERIIEIIIRSVRCYHGAQYKTSRIPALFVVHCQA
jgi:hypothetical protein